jgi:hypothetical protein
MSHSLIKRHFAGKNKSWLQTNNYRITAISRAFGQLQKFYSRRESAILPGVGGQVSKQITFLQKTDISDLKKKNLLFPHNTSESVNKNKEDIH